MCSLNKYRSIFQTCIIVILLSSLTVCVQPPAVPNFDHLGLKPKIENLNKIPLKGKPVPPCIACQSLVKSFLVAVDRTNRQGFAGGDADWEKQKLGAYENSELRFIEIQEMLCADVEFGTDQCYNLAELYESELEDWFYEKRKNSIDLFDSLCINHIKVCCPNNTYGPKCIPCPGGIEKPCGGHGKCQKAGTREEPATCVCDTGYAGDLCGECERGHYPDTTDSSCKKCDRACRGHCRGPGPKNCEVCAPGHHFISDSGCIEDSGDGAAETGDTSNSNEVNPSSQVNASDEVTEKDEEMQLKSNIKDSTTKLPHSEF